MTSRRTRDAECLRCHRVRAHHGRGLCRSCHMGETRRGTIEDWPRQTWTAGEVAAEAEHFTRSGYSLDYVASVLGIKRDSLLTALRRHRRRLLASSHEC